VTGVADVITLRYGVFPSPALTPPLPLRPDRCPVGLDRADDAGQARWPGGAPPTPPDCGSDVVFERHRLSRRQLPQGFGRGTYWYVKRWNAEGTTGSTYAALRAATRGAAARVEERFPALAEAMVTWSMIDLMPGTGPAAGRGALNITPRSLTRHVQRGEALLPLGHSEIRQ